MDGKYNEIELLFVREVLDRHGEYLTDLFVEEIEKKRLKDSGDLLGSVDYKVTKYGIDPVLTFSFYSYGRAIEIRWHKRSQNTQKWVTNTNNVIWGANRKPRRRKNTLWYARNLYGSINRLMGILSSEFSQEEIKRLQGILDHQKIRMTI